MLIVEITNIYGNTVEFLVGETEEKLEPVGRLTAHHTASYTPFETKEINSFYMTRKLSGEKSIELLTPGVEIALKFGDLIGWGYDEPLVSIECYNRMLH